MSDDTPWLDRNEQETWLRLSGVLMALPAAIDAQLKRDACINYFEYSILAQLSHQPGRTMQLSALADMAGGSQSRLSHAISRLEKVGWVKRQAANCDVRAVHAVLTDDGFAKLAATAPGHVREVRRLVFDALGDDHGKLNEVCRRMLAEVLPKSPHMIDQALASIDREQERRAAPAQ